MPVFKYRAKKGPEQIVDSQVIAVSQKDAIEKISAMGLMPVKVEEISGSSVDEALLRGVLIQAVPGKMVTVFSRQLSVLLRSGVPILSALTILSDQNAHAYLKQVIRTIGQDVRDGKSLSIALSRFPKLFSSLYLALVRSGEDSGTLDEALMRIALYRQKQEQIWTNIKTALAYPLLMGFVGIATIVFMLTFVMPRLLEIFSRLGQELPLPTRMMMQLSAYLREGWWLILIILILIGGFWKFGMKSKKEKLLFSGILLKLPVIGNVFLKAELARFSRTLEILLKSGIQLLRAIKIGTPVLDNEIIRDELLRGYQNIEQGESFAQVLGRSRIFPKFMVNLVKIGEESGRLEESLGEVATCYEEETDEAVKIMTNLLEPLMILVMGAIVGFIIVAMLLPVFQINIMIK